MHSYKLLFVYMVYMYVYYTYILYILVLDTFVKNIKINVENDTQLICKSMVSFIDHCNDARTPIIIICISLNREQDM